MSPHLIRILDSICNVLTPDVARKIADLRADDETQSWLEDMSQRHHEGQLSSKEIREYEQFDNALCLISLLQVRAKKMVAEGNLT